MLIDLTKLQYYIVVYLEDGSHGIEKNICPASDFVDGVNKILEFRMAIQHGIEKRETFELLETGNPDDVHQKWVASFSKEQIMELWYSTYLMPELYCLQGWKDGQFTCVCDAANFRLHEKWNPEW